MGIAQNGVSLAGGENLAIAGQMPAGIAIAGETVWTGTAKNWQLLGSVTAVPPSKVSAAMNTTGANLLVIIGINYLIVPIVLDDSQNNIWTTGVTYTYPAGGTTVTSRITYCINPSTSVNHTFSFSGPDYNALIIWAFKAPSPINTDKSVWNYTTGTSLSLPALTPATDNSLIIAAITNGNDILGISGGFTMNDNVLFNPGINYGGAGAYLIQESASSVAPIWNLSTSLAAGTAATMMNFVPA